MLSEQTVNAVRELPVVDIAELYIKDLRRSGSIYKGHSPFNEERTPSFTVSETKNIWHDFSAGVGGDGIKLVMLMEHLTFPEAVEKLCEMFNIPIEFEDNKVHKRYSSDTLELYCEWCIDNLKKRKDIQEYLYSRGLNNSSINSFEIGYAPTSKETIAFVRENLNLEEAKLLGIIDEGKRGFYARFIDRIMFPVRDHIGKLCGFSGRTVSNHPAKYVNSPDTPLFKKSKLLYGYHIAKKAVNKSGNFILCEGQMDVVLMHQAGLNTTFASMGTALTEEHVKIIGRNAMKGIVAYDGDEAGLRAANKAACLFSQRSISTSIIVFENGEDPADMISAGKKDEVEALLKKGVPAIQFCVDRVVEKYDISDPFQKKKAYDFILKEASRMHSIVRQSMIEYATSILGIIREVPQPAQRKSKGSVNSVLQREKELIKTAMDSKEKREALYETIKCFHLKEQIEKLWKEDFSDDELTNIYLDEKIPRSRNFEYDLLSIKFACLNRYILAVKNSKNMGFQTKVIEIREAQAKLNEIKKKMGDQRDD